jgi:hypothetical protein
MVHVARTSARDDLAEMFCKRMASITKLAKAELDEIRERQAEMSERLITNYRGVLACLDRSATATRYRRAPGTARRLRTSRSTATRRTPATPTSTRCSATPARTRSTGR